MDNSEKKNLFLVMFAHFLNQFCDFSLIVVSLVLCHPNKFEPHYASALTSQLLLLP